MASPKETALISAGNHIDLELTLEKQQQQQQQQTIPRITASRVSDNDGEKHAIVAASSEPETFLYLGFGSNLAKSIFEGRRHVQPLSQINVHVPQYELTFDLPGIAYAEPCFANSRRRVPAGTAIGTTIVADGTSDSDDERDDSGDIDKERVVVAIEEVDSSEEQQLILRTAENLGWSKGLVGTVYEVTAADFKHIIETEGGGVAYVDTLVEAWPLAPGTAVVPDPDSYPVSPSSSPSTTKPDLSLIKPNGKPQPFLVHTLVAPLWPKDSPLFRKPNWAQASSRYIGLLRTGARERGLPDEYIAWLDGLTAYQATSWRQKVGRAVFVATWLPPFAVLRLLSTIFSDKQGRTPAWLNALMKGLQSSSWSVYDKVMKPLAGDGERTIGT